MSAQLHIKSIVVELILILPTAVENFKIDKKFECGKASWCKQCWKEYNEKNKNHRLKIDKDRNAKIADENKKLSINDLRLKTPIKFCSRCKLHKSTIEFGRLNKLPDGFNHICKRCKNENKKYITRHNKRQLINSSISTEKLYLITPNKICRTCNLQKSTNKFSRNSSFKDGFSSQCKQCRNLHYHNNKLTIKK